MIYRKSRLLRVTISVLAFVPLAISSAFAQPVQTPPPASAPNCAADNGGITLSPGFCASVFADNLGHARHLVVAPNGVLYVNTWSGRYYHDDTPPPGGFVLALKDTKGVGKADVIQRFGDGADKGAAGGTGIALHNGALYVESNDRILRYALSGDSITPAGEPQVVVSGLPLTGEHPMHPFTIDAKGNLYVDVGTATNVCQPDDHAGKVPGAMPCTELETRGGIWRYDADKMGQQFSPADRFSTGIRNGEGFAMDSAGRLFVTQHGRDLLAQSWPEFYTVKQGAELPAEEVVQLEKDGDYGWPECYFDGFQKKLVLAPEYGGDGGRKQGICAQKKAPVAFFPGHWAPNDMVYSSGTQFPEAYRGGMFIAFHGSWNRAPLPQAGFRVVYQPMADGKASGDYVTFADGFLGGAKDRDTAAFRPTGLAIGPDGALYISDDVHGRIWRVVYTGGSVTAGIASAPGAKTQPSAPDNNISGAASLPVPPGATRQQVALGDRIFHGEASGGTCSGCHGTDGRGTQVGPDLTRGVWSWGDGSLKAISATIVSGVPNPKGSSGPMPPKGGAALSQSDVAAVAAYVWAIGHRN
jgi:glucose/arabinose dehydrogenase